MKYRGCTSYFSEDAAEDVWQLYNKLLKDTRGELMLKEIYEVISHSPAPRYYVTARRAYEVVNMLASKKPMCKMYPQRRAMYMDILKAARKLRRSNRKMTLRDAVDVVVDQPAPSFYLSPGCIKNMIHKKNHRRDEDI